VTGGKHEERMELAEADWRKQERGGERVAVTAFAEQGVKWGMGEQKDDREEHLAIRDSRGRGTQD